MRVSPGRTGGFESCAAQSGRLESLTRPQSFGHLIDRLRKMSRGPAPRDGPQDRTARRSKATPRNYFNSQVQPVKITVQR